MTQPYSSVNPLLIDALNITKPGMQAASQELLLAIKEQLQENHKEGKPATVYVGEPTLESLEEVATHLASVGVTVIDGKDKSNNYFLHLYCNLTSTALIAQAQPVIKNSTGNKSLYARFTDLLAAPFLWLKSLVFDSFDSNGQTQTPVQSLPTPPPKPPVKCQPSEVQDTSIQTRQNNNPTLPEHNVPIPDSRSVREQQLQRKQAAQEAKARENEREFVEALRLMPSRLTKKIMKAMEDPDCVHVELDGRELPKHCLIEFRMQDYDPLRNRQGWWQTRNTYFWLDITLVPEADQDLADVHRRIVCLLREKFVPSGYKIYVRENRYEHSGSRHICLAWSTDNRSVPGSADPAVA